MIRASAGVALLLFACSAPEPDAEVARVTSITSVGIGQSIMEGNDGTFSLAGGASIRGMDLNGNLITNPTSLNNGSPFIVPLHAIRNTGGPHQSFMGYLAEALLANGLTSVDVMSGGYPGSSALDWAPSAATSTLCGSSIAMTNLLLSQSNIAQDFFVVDLQGHADTIVEADALAWLGRKRATRDFWRAKFGRPHMLWVVGVPPPTNPSAGTRPYWANIVADGFTFGSDDADSRAVQAPDGPFIDGPVGGGGIHPTEAAQRVHAASMALRIAAYYAPSPPASPVVLGRGSAATVANSAAIMTRQWPR